MPLAISAALGGRVPLGASKTIAIGSVIILHKPRTASNALRASVTSPGDVFAVDMFGLRWV